jgi:hypothetical protein
VGSGVFAGWATAVSSTPRAALMASIIWRSLIRKRNCASGSAATSARASRVAASPRASAGTEADGSAIVNASAAASTSRSMRRSASTVPAGEGRFSIPNSPDRPVSIPSKKVVSRSGAATVLARRR